MRVAEKHVKCVTEKLSTYFKTFCTKIQARRIVIWGKVSRIVQL